jgi:cobalt-zinc-cadmium efflux system membrane fusion protein
VSLAWLLLLASAGLPALSIAAVTNASSPEGPAAAQRSFRITPDQAKGLRLAAVTAEVLHTEQHTDGKIALNGDRLTPVFPPFSGRVLRVLAAPGDLVRPGEPLLEVESAEFAQARGDLRTAQGTLRTARSQLELAHANEERRRALYEAEGGSLQEWQQSRNDSVAADSAARSAESALALVRDRLHLLGRSDAEIGALGGGSQGDAIVQVVAPIAGTITDRQVGPGQFLQASASTPLFAISDLSTVWLVAYVRESEAVSLRRDQTVEVTVPALPKRVFKARLSYVSPTIDPATHRLPVRAVIPNPDALLKPEMFASFSIATSADRRVVTVPEAAIVHDGDSLRVWVELRPGELAARAIQVGTRHGDRLEVVSGLREGERVVTRGTLFIDRAAAGD